jgi:hypothetical protein
MPPTHNTPGAHIRGNRISGDTQRLNEKAVKILAIVKFAPTSIGREDIVEQSSFPREDVERQVKLLLTYRLIVLNSRFPPFPQQGWRVFTERTKHTQIINILRQHGYQDEASRRTREALDGYFPSGMALEGIGTQRNNGRTYPPLVPVNEDLDYKEEAINVMDKWRDEIKPFQPKEFSQVNLLERKKKFQWLAEKLAEVYGIRKPLVSIGRITAETYNAPLASGSSNYNRLTHTITMEGKISILTFLHEFGHARGFDETDATLWSVNIFKRTFPVSYSKLKSEGHTLTQHTGDQSFRSEPYRDEV